MSADKKKKLARAYALIKMVRKFGYDYTTFSGPATKLMKYCVKKGMAIIRREPRRGYAMGRNRFDTMER